MNSHEDLLQGNYTGYMHLSCALKEAEDAGVELQPPVCKHWSRRGYCLYKDKCFYRHPAEALPAQELPAVPIQSASGSNASQRKANRGIGKRNLVRNAFRASVFRRFLIDTFGRELLGSGSGVLDVAGGKGELSYELVNLNGIASTVVEPRALQLWRQHKWMLKGYYHRNANFQTYVDVPHKDFVSGEHTTTDPPHLRMVFNGAIVNSLLQPAAPLPAKSCQAAQGEAVTHLPKQPAIGNSAQQAESSSAQTPAEPSAEHSASALQATGSSAQQADGSSAQTQPAGPSLVQAACSLGQQANGISAQTPVERPSAKQGASALKAADALVQLAGKPHGRVGTGPTNHPQCAAHMGQCQTAQCTPAACTASLMTTAGQQPSVNTAEKHPQQVNDQYRLQLAEHQEDSSRAPSCADQSADSSCCSSGLESRLQPGSGLLDVDGCQPTGEQGTEWNSMFRHSMKLAKNIKWTHKGLQHEHEDGASWSDSEPAGEQAVEPVTCNAADQAVQSQEELRDGPTDITDAQEAWDTIQHCSVIVGMHPDQAAEPIIDFAQRTQKPFAMVPCCVYPVEFPHRRLPDGTWVRKYEQLIEYLQARNPCVRVATLPFEGRNQVVYCTTWTARQ